MDGLITDTSNLPSQGVLILIDFNKSHVTVSYLNTNYQFQGVPRVSARCPLIITLSRKVARVMLSAPVNENTFPASS